MAATSTFRFLALASALALWIGVVATAGEALRTDDGGAPAVATAPPAPPDEGAAVDEEGGEAPAEDSTVR